MQREWLGLLDQTPTTELLAVGLWQFFEPQSCVLSGAREGRYTLYTLQGRSVRKSVVGKAQSAMPACGTLTMGRSHSAYRDTNQLYEASRSVRTRHELGLRPCSHRKTVAIVTRRNRCLIRRIFARKVSTSLGFPIRNVVTLCYVSDDPPTNANHDHSHRRKRCDRESQRRCRCHEVE